MPLFEYNVDVLDAAYKSETSNMTEHDLITYSRKWHERIMKVIELEAQNPTSHSAQRLDALRQVYMFYMIKYSYTA